MHPSDNIQLDKKGKLKGHKIDNHIFVGKKAIVVLFDTAAAVARMKESLKLHKKELKAEIKNRDKAIIAELREENEMLRSKTDNLTEQVENLREKVKELTTTRKIQNTPFEMDVTRLGLNPRTLLFLDEIGCKNLADLVCLNRGVFIKSRKAGVNTLMQVERKLEGKCTPCLAPCDVAPCDGEHDAVKARRCEPSQTN